MGVWYCTREQVKSVLDVAATARADARVDACIEHSSRSLDGQLPGSGFLGRRFYPELATRSFDWPNSSNARPYRLWLGPNDLISASAVVTGAVTLGASDYLLRNSPDGPDTGPPYHLIEISLAGTSGFSGGSSHQRNIVITGTWGYNVDDVAAGALAAAVVSASATSIDVTFGGLIGVGALLKIDTERMIVTERSWLTTAQTLQSAVGSNLNEVTLAVTTGSAFLAGDVLLLDSERMLVVDVAGNNLTVKRAFDGSVLAAHAGSTIFASRRLTVTRGVLGTTAATHLISAPITYHRVPGPVNELALAEATNELLQGQLGFDPRQAGVAVVTGFGREGLTQLRTAVDQAYGRGLRVGAV